MTLDVFLERRLSFVGSVDAARAVGRVGDDGVDGSDRKVSEDVESFPGVDESGGGISGRKDAGNWGMGRGFHLSRITIPDGLSTTVALLCA